MVYYGTPISKTPIRYTTMLRIQPCPRPSFVGSAPRLRWCGAALALLFIAHAAATAQRISSPWFHREAYKDSAIFTRHGSVLRVMMNGNGLLGAEALPYDSAKLHLNTSYFPPFQFIPPMGLEYPIGVPFEHLRAGGLWVGAIANTRNGRKKLVSTTVGASSTQEFFGHEFASDTVFYAGILDLHRPARRGFDDDNDGLIDEDEPDGIDNDGDWDREGDDLNFNFRPDHGEPHVDEDGAARSERDAYVAFRDTFAGVDTRKHTPLRVRVWQKMYSWSRLVKEPILPIEYVITNNGRDELDSVYVGFYAQVFLGPYFPVNSLFGNSVPRRYTLGFNLPMQTAFVSAVWGDVNPAPPVGFTLLGASEPLTNLHISYTRMEPAIGGLDEAKYNLMASGVIQRDTMTQPTFSYPQMVIALGPFRHIGVHDKITFTMALVAGENVLVGHNNIMDNAARALELYNRDWRPPNFPPSPPLRFTATNNGALIDWKWRPGDPKADPMETWDDYNRYLESLPDTHWRKRNPPPGKTRGGRIFEAFRLWRSEYPVYQENSFSLIREFDIDDDLNFGGQVGVQYAFLDTPLVRGRKYYYSVTTTSIPDYYITFDSVDGGLVRDTIQSSPFESPLFENAATFQLQFIPSSKVGDVKVVPNPYRTDQDYYYEAGGWEGLARSWSEFKRMVWFIHLPPRCTIRIFTIMGEVVKVIEHDDEARQAQNVPIGQEEFLLLSESNRAIASGVYVYLVESAAGTQTGKFVVIR